MTRMLEEPHEALFANEIPGPVQLIGRYAKAAVGRTGYSREPCAHASGGLDISVLVTPPYM